MHRQYSGLPSFAEPALNTAPVYFAIESTPDEHKVKHCAERRPNSLVIGVLDLGVHDEVRHEMLGRRHPNSRSVELVVYRLLEHLGSGKYGIANAHTQAVVQLKRHTPRSPQRRMMMPEPAKLISLVPFEAVLNKNFGSGR
jgi:hypothetical protein